MLIAMIVRMLQISHGKHALQGECTCSSLPTTFYTQLLCQCDAAFRSSYDHTPLTMHRHETCKHMPHTGWSLQQLEDDTEQ